MSLPTHVAIIMDGNGRWAKKRLMPRTLGHREGVKRVREIVKHSGKLGIKYLTLFTFSTENWKRPKKEINTLLDMLAEHLYQEKDELEGNNVRFKVIGRRDRLPQNVLEGIDFLETETARNTGLTLVLAIDYGGKGEIVRAANQILKTLSKNESFDETVFRKFLYYPDLPDPDLLIRTGGEYRISNFLLFELAYTEIFFTDTLWPDFKVSEYNRALEFFQMRERRFGGIGDKS